MRICIVSTYMRSIKNPQGGVERHVNDLLTGLTGRGHKIDLVTAKNSVEPKESSLEGLRIHRLNINVKSHGNPFSRKIFCRKAVDKVSKLNKTKNFDILNIQGHFPLEVVKLDIPTTITLHGACIPDLISNFQSRRWNFLIWLVLLPYYFLKERRSFRAADSVITVSPWLKEYVTKYYKVSDANIDVVLNGIDTGNFKPEPSKRKKYSDNDEIVIFSVSHLTKQKGANILIKAFSKLLYKNTNLKLVLGGDGPQLPALKKLAKRLGISDKVIFPGWINNNELPEYYNSADIFAFPTFKEEGLPYVVIEAMACGLPIVASSKKGIQNLITNYKEGLLVKPGSISDLTKKLKKILDEKELRMRLGNNAREKAKEELNVKRMIDEYEKKFKDVIDQ